MAEYNVPFTLENLQKVTHICVRSNDELMFYYYHDGRQYYIDQSTNGDEWGIMDPLGLVMVLKFMQAITGQWFDWVDAPPRQAGTIKGWYIRPDYLADHPELRPTASSA